VEQTFLPLITLTPMPMKPLQKGEDGLQVLEALEMVCVNRWCIHTRVICPPPRKGIFQKSLDKNLLIMYDLRHSQTMGLSWVQEVRNRSRITNYFRFIGRMKVHKSFKINETNYDSSLF